MTIMAYPNYTVRLEVQSPLPSEQCPPGFVIHNSKLCVKTSDGSIIQDDGTPVFLVLPEDYLHPVKILGTTRVVENA
jgi:hypothetical protein